MPDEFQPRVKIKKVFNAGMLSTEEEMQQFSENFAVEMHLIKTYMFIAHLEDLKQQSSIFKRTRGRKEPKHKLASKTFRDYAWHHLMESGDSQKLLVLSSINKIILNITNS